MIKKKLIIIAAALCSFANIASADITIISNSKKLTNICGDLSGHWEGNGVMSSYPAPWVRCTYAGQGDLMSANDTGEFQVKVEMKRTSGLCPESYGPEVWVGTCANNKLTFKSEKVELNGSLENNGQNAVLKGFVMNKTFYVEKLALEKKPS